jgi:hypothetical protein
VAEFDDLTVALRKARLAEAAHFEAVLGIRDSKSLRLQVLKDELSPIVASNAEASRLFDLALVPGEDARLWIDLISSVVMEPDYRTYRLVQDNQGGREVLFETVEREEMLEYLKSYLAHRIVARERMMASTPSRGDQTVRYSSGSLLYAWLSGFILGLLALLIAAISLGKLKI